MRIVLLLCSFYYCAASQLTDPFANFGSSTNNVVLLSADDVWWASGVFPAGNTLIVQQYGSYSFIKLDSNGTQLATLSAPFGYSGNSPDCSVYWGSSYFVTAGENKVAAYDYNLTPIASFGLNGIKTLDDVIGLQQLTAVTSEGTYIYVGGGIQVDDSHFNTTIVRLTLDGRLDTTFNSSNTPGYIMIDSNGWTPHQLLVVNKHLIIKTSDNQLISLSLTDSSNISVVNNISFGETCSMTADSKGKSLYTLQGTTLYKYDTLLNADTSLNPTGQYPGQYTLDFASISDTLTNPNIMLVQMINNQLFVGGTYQPSNTNDSLIHNTAHIAPFLISYNVNNSVPTLDTSFLGTGYFIGHYTDYPYNGTNNPQDPNESPMKITLTQNYFPTIFFTCGPHITRLPLNYSFVQNSQIIPPTVTNKIAYYTAQNKIIPILAGMSFL